MKEKIKIIDNLGIIDKKSYRGILPTRSHYEIQKIEFKGKIFYRRQKICENKVTSCSYSADIETKRWESSLNKFVKNL